MTDTDLIDLYKKESSDRFNEIDNELISKFTDAAPLRTDPWLVAIIAES